MEPDAAADDRRPHVERREPLGDAGAHPSRRRLLGVAGVFALAGCTLRPGSKPTPPPPSNRLAPTATGVGTTRTTRTFAARTVRTPHPVQRGAQAVEIGRGSDTRPVVALTFHGAGDPALASAILDTVGRHKSRITVMAVGTWIAANPPIAARILADGHELGNHTWSHRVLRSLDRAHARIEIERCRDELVRLTGSPGRWFRQSGSPHSTPLIRSEAGRAGYRVCLSYDVDSLDWTDPGPAAVVRNVRAAAAGSIVSLHLGHPGTLAALPAILGEFDARRLRAVTVSELLGP